MSSKHTGLHTGYLKKIMRNFKPSHEHWVAAQHLKAKPHLVQLAFNLNSVRENYSAILCSLLTIIQLQYCKITNYTVYI